MKRKCVSGVAALLTACPWATLAQADEADPIRIGYVAAMTGVLAPYDSVDGARCQIARINEAGGVLGRKLELESRDMKSDAVSGSVAALALAQQIPVLSVGSTAVQFPLASPTNSYLTAFGDNLSAAAIAQYAAEQGYKSAALMVSRDFGSYGIVVPNYFADAFQHHGGSILGEVNYNIGLSDYSAQIAAVKAMNPQPELIVGGFIAPENGVIPRQFKAGGVEAKFMGTDGYDDPGLPSIAGAGADSVTFVTHGFPSEGTELKAFYDDCTARGYKIQNVFFALAGETVLLIADAITRAGSAEPADVNAALAVAENVKGITSDSITYKDRAGIPLKELTVVTIKDGVFEPVGRMTPDYVPAP